MWGLEEVGAPCDDVRVTRQGGAIEIRFCHPLSELAQPGLRI